MASKQQERDILTKRMRRPGLVRRVGHGCELELLDGRERECVLLRIPVIRTATLARA